MKNILKTLLLSVALIAPFAVAEETINSGSPSSNWEKPGNDGWIVFIVEGDFGTGSTVTVQLRSDSDVAVTAGQTCTADCSVRVNTGSFAARVTITDVQGSPSLDVSHSRP